MKIEYLYVDDSFKEILKAKKLGGIRVGNLEWWKSKSYKVERFIEFYL